MILRLIAIRGDKAEICFNDAVQSDDSAVSNASFSSSAASF